MPGIEKGRRLEPDRSKAPPNRRTAMTARVPHFPLISLLASLRVEGAWANKQATYGSDPRDVQYHSSRGRQRHMKILEKCSSSWPMPDMFSADTRKPFVFKPTFSYGSSGAPVNTTPPRLDVEGMDTKSDSPAIQSLMIATSQRSSQPPITLGVPMAGQSPWNLSTILD
jgi:hypothetical protein